MVLVCGPLEEPQAERGIGTPVPGLVNALKMLLKCPASSAAYTGFRQFSYFCNDLDFRLEDLFAKFREMLNHLANLQRVLQKS